MPQPVAGPGEVLVRVHSSSVNAFDVGVASGAMKAYMPYEFPAVIGSDLAGTIEAVGDGVDGFSPGDRVFGMMGAKGAIHDGSFAELANPQAASIAIAPTDLSDADAGTLAVAGTTAMSAVEAFDPSEGAHVLILGATGGVGTFAIRLAALRGAHVIASVRPGDEEFVTGLGAAETVDYTGDVIAAIRERYPDGVDAVIDAVNRDPNVFAALAGVVREDGRATSVVAGQVGHGDGVARAETPPDTEGRSRPASRASRPRRRTSGARRRTPLCVGEMRRHVLEHPSIRDDQEGGGGNSPS